jgi:hypothetical protein
MTAELPAVLPISLLLRVVGYADAVRSAIMFHSNRGGFINIEQYQMVTETSEVDPSPLISLDY